MGKILEDGGNVVCLGGKKIILGMERMVWDNMGFSQIWGNEKKAQKKRKKEKTKGKNSTLKTIFENERIFFFTVSSLPLF